MSLLFKFRPLVINPLLAERIGLNEAIVLQQLKYWLNETESGVDHDGHRWIYNTVDQWQKQFPFWSVDTVKRALKSLQCQGIILAEQLAKSKHDRTYHYAINYQSNALFEQGNLPCSEGGNLPSSNGAGCPVLHTENTTKTTPEIHVAFERFWTLYPRKEKKAAAEKAWEKLKVNPELFALIAQALAKQATSVDWLKSKGQFIPHPSSWLNGKRWEDEPGPQGARASAYKDLPQHTPEMYAEVPNGQPNF
jgi:hypothetical protein